MSEEILSEKEQEVRAAISVAAAAIGDLVKERLEHEMLRVARVKHPGGIQPWNFKGVFTDNTDMLMSWHQITETVFHTRTFKSLVTMLPFKVGDTISQLGGEQYEVIATPLEFDDIHDNGVYLLRNAITGLLTKVSSEVTHLNFRRVLEEEPVNEQEDPPVDQIEGESGDETPPDSESDTTPEEPEEDGSGDPEPDPSTEDPTEP